VWVSQGGAGWSIPCESGVSQSESSLHLSYIVIEPIGILVTFVWCRSAEVELEHSMRFQREPIGILLTLSYIVKEPIGVLVTFVWCRSAEVELEHSMRFQRERLTCIYNGESAVFSYHYL
jgi:hypothetical protein